MENSPEIDPHSDSMEESKVVDDPNPLHKGFIFNLPGQKEKANTNDLNGTNNPVTLKQNEIKPLTSQTKEVSQKTKIDDIYSSYMLIGKTSRVFNICFGIAIVFVMTILGLSSALFIYDSVEIGGTIVGFSIFSIFTCFFTIYIIRKNRLLINDVIGLKDDPEKITQSRPRMLLYICCYFMMIMIVFFLFIGNGILAYPSNIKMRIRGIGYEKEKWEEYFEKETFTQVIDRVTVFIIALAGLCILFSLYIFAILISLLVQIKSYRTWKLMIQFICILFFQICFIFIHYGTNGLRFKNATLIDESMPGWVTGGLFGIGIVGLFIGLFAFFITFIEHKKLLYVYSIISVIMCIILILLNIGGTMISANFQGYLDAECNSLFSYVDQEYLIKQTHCKNKYLFTTKSLDNLQCPKYRVVVAWEYDQIKSEGNNEDTYGCINQRCCMIIYSHIKEIYDYLILMSYFLMLISMLFILSSCYLIRNLEKYYDEGIRDNFIYYFILAMLILISVIMIPLLATIPNAPLSSNLARMKIHPTNNEAVIVPSEIIIPMSVETFRQDNINIIRETSQAVINANQYTLIYQTTRNNKFILDDFHIKLECSNAYFMENPNNKFDSSITMVYNHTIEDKKKDTNSIMFKGNLSSLNNYLRYIIVQPYCEVSKVTVLLTVTGIVKTRIKMFEDRENDNVSQLQNKEEIIVDLSRPSINEGDNQTAINDRELDFSLVDVKNMIKLTGEVYKKINSSVLVYPNFKKECAEYLETNFDISTGKFEIGPLYEYKSKRPILYHITITNNMPNANVKPYFNDIMIGGLNKVSKQTNLGVIYYAETAKTSSIQGLVVDSLTNQPINKIEIQLYDDFIIFNPADSSPKKKIDFLESFRTGQLGYFSFFNLAQGQYTLYFTNNEFYLETVHIDLKDSSLFDLGSIALTRMKDLGELSFVLSWPNGPIDLDLYSSFPVESDQFCTVSFTNHNCVAMKMDTMNDYGGKHGVESLTMREMERNYYMFYVHKYHDVSHDIAAGENKIKGLDILPEYNTSGVPDTSLSQSQAEIKIYGPGYRTPIISLQIDDSPSYDDTYVYWLAFCIDGNIGISSYKIINKLMKTEPDKNYCKNYYKP